MELKNFHVFIFCKLLLGMNSTIRKVLQTLYPRPYVNYLKRRIAGTGDVGRDHGTANYEEFWKLNILEKSVDGFQRQWT